MNSKSPELATAIDAARKAAKICAAAYHSLVQEAQKSGREPVTIADFASQAIINDILKTTFPDDHLLGEEHGEDFINVMHADQRVQVVQFAAQGLGYLLMEADIKDMLDNTEGNINRTWIIDPLDGTKGFINRRAYAVAIALKDSAGIRLGVLACPNLSIETPGQLGGDGAIFYAERGTGAYRQHLNEDSDPIRLTVSDTKMPHRLLSSYESGHTNKGLFAEIVDNLPQETTTTGLDGQGKYGLVANGDFEAYFRLVPKAGFREKVWDHAAGTIIVQEAGGKVTDFSGKPLDYSKGERLTDNQGIVVSNDACHDTILAAIAQTNWQTQT